MIYPYIYRLRVLWGGDSPYFGRGCRIVAHNRPKNTRLIEFENGERAIVSGNAIRKKPAPPVG